MSSFTPKYHPEFRPEDKEDSRKFISSSIEFFNMSLEISEQSKLMALWDSSLKEKIVGIDLIGTAKMEQGAENFNRSYGGTKPPIDKSLPKPEDVNILISTDIVELPPVMGVSNRPLVGHITLRTHPLLSGLPITFMVANALAYPALLYAQTMMDRFPYLTYRSSRDLRVGLSAAYCKIYLDSIDK